MAILKKFVMCDTVKPVKISTYIAMKIMGVISKLQSSSSHPEAEKYVKKKSKEAQSATLKWQLHSTAPMLAKFFSVYMV